MAILERHIQILRAGNLIKKWEQLEKEWCSLEKRLGGFSDKRYYDVICAGHNATGTIVWEREWENFAAMEAAYPKMFQEKETNSLAERSSELVAEDRLEMYGVRSV